MSFATATTRPDRKARRRDTHTNKQSYKIPLQVTAWGTNSLAGRVCSVRSRSCSESRNVQPQSYPSKTPINHLNGTRIIIYPITEYNQSSSLHVNPVHCSANPVYCMPSLSLMEHYTTSTPPLKTSFVLKTDLFLAS